MVATRARLAAPATAPVRLRVLMTALLLASLAWGALATWTVAQHSAAASDVVSASEPLSLTAQAMYQSLSDADITATTAFLGGPDVPLAARQRYAADVAGAATDLASLRGAAGPASQGLLTSLAAVSAGLPVYTQDVAQAQTEYSLGYLLTGGSFMQVAAEQMHLTLLPAARSIYAAENAQLTAETGEATGLPWIAVALLAAAGLGLLLYLVQRGLTRRTHRIVNYGLLLASALLAAATAWLLIAYGVARTDLDHAVGNGSAPAETLAQAGIDAQQVRGDELVNLISRSGDATFVADSHAVAKRLGPGPGTLIAVAAAAGPGSDGAQWAATAGRDARAWYAVDDQVYKLDSQARYAAETRLVIGTADGASSADFARVEGDLSQAIAADQVVFHASATAGSDAFAGLAVGIALAAVAMAAGCAWGLAVRIAEYR